MAKYKNSPFGTISGEQSGVVGSTWKGINYIRRFVIPANPQSALQTTQRAKFKNVSEFGRHLVNTILNTYWVPKPKKKSAYNDFVGRNVKLQTSAVMDLTLVKTSFGSLFNPGISSLTVDGTTHVVDVAWDMSLQGDANGADIAVLVVLNEMTNIFTFPTVDDRSTGAASFSANSATGDVFHAWLLFTDSAMTIASDSAYKTATAS